MVITTNAVVHRAEKELVARHRHVSDVVGMERIGGAPGGQGLVVVQVVAKHTDVFNRRVEDATHFHHFVGFRDSVKRGNGDA